ncbi:protein Mabiki-like [Calliphora vicina]|uniref:protein Mabiki-like n=1 Tax=Calliphora vicina TaxID=7373 RepID=UPI00325AC30C
MNSLNFTATMEESFEYLHKKFDQSSKRLRSDSLSSSTGDYECIQVEIERISEIAKATSPSSSSNSQETNNKRSYSPDTSESNYSEAKRPRSSSFGSYTQAFSRLNTQRQTSTPFTSSAVAVPPAAAILPKISDETLRSICKYHGNMVRKYPKVQRSAKDQERRDKNTLACRMSRRVKKLEHIAIEEQYKEFSQQTFDIVEQSMRSTAYLHELMQLLSCQQLGEMATQQPNNSILLTESPSISSAQQKKPFTIAFLAGREE